MCCYIISLVADTWKHYRSRRKNAIITLPKKPSCDIEMMMRDISEETVPTVKSDADVVDVKSSDNKTKTTPFGRYYELRDIEAATNGFANTNVIGAGDYGDVFRGSLFTDADNTQVVVKKLLRDSSNMEQGFGREAEAMLMLKHRNLVKLLGYHAEGSNRMLVSEYVDNGNLNYWLHHYKCIISPLTWDIRMKIILGIAKGLSYLHEDIEPAIVHQNLKSSNVLLDQQWNPKISDFGIPKLLGIRWGIYTSPPNGMSGYIAPEYHRTRVLDESSDVYSFGILMMEIISGRTSTETLHEIEENLVDRIKSQTREGKYYLIPDPKLLPELPSMSKLRRIVHIALCCVDPNIRNRPNMGQIVQMLEPRVFQRLSHDVKEVKNKSYWFNWRNS